MVLAAVQPIGVMFRDIGNISSTLIFCLHSDFDFARYLILAQEKNAVEMLEVTIWQRLVILLFVALNIGREKLGITAAIRRAHEIALRKECNSYKSSDEGTEVSSAVFRPDRSYWIV